MSHATIVSKFTKALEKVGAETYAVVAGGMAPAGWPDRHFIWHGWPVQWVEFKYARDDLSHLQRIRMRRLLDLGCPVIVVHLDPPWAGECGGIIRAWVPHPFKDSRLVAANTLLLDSLTRYGAAIKQRISHDWWPSLHKAYAAARAEGVTHARSGNG